MEDFAGRRSAPVGARIVVPRSSGVNPASVDRRRSLVLSDLVGDCYRDDHDAIMARPKTDAPTDP